MRSAEEAPAPASVVALAAQRVEAELGLRFDGSRRRQFELALGRMAAALRHPSVQDCAAWLLDGVWDHARSAACARFLTIGETYFFREPSALDLLCEQARAHAARQPSRPLRIWSAGCCTGEEPYSIAMTLRRRVPQLAPDMVSILATDLNDVFIAFARAGAYRRWSFRRTDPVDMAAHFRPRGDGLFEIDPALRAQVRFAQLNLAGAGYPSALTATLGIDIIFCRNVLMYFGRAQAKRVIARLRDSLGEGGWLVVNASEASAELFEGFTSVWRGDALFFRKDAMSAAPAPAPPPVTHGAPLAARPDASLRQAALPPADQSSVEAILERASRLAAAGALDEALQGLRRAIEAAPLSTPLQLGIVLFALEHGARAMARSGVRRLLYLDPSSAIGHYLAALIEDECGGRPQARHLLEQCRVLAAQAGDSDLPSDAAIDSAGPWWERMR